MSTIAIIAIVIGAIIVIALIAAAARRNSERRQFAQAQTDAHRDYAQHERGHAEERRREAAVAEERAKRAAAVPSAATWMRRKGCRCRRTAALVGCQFPQHLSSRRDRARRIALLAGFGSAG